jgi:hypothetical protein
MMDLMVARGRQRWSRPGTVVIESCNSTWLFDPGQRLFCRVPRSTAFEVAPPRSGWEPYFALDVDPNSEAFVVTLNEAGTRMLRSWRHIERCAQCGGDGTAELYLDTVAPGAG